MDEWYICNNNYIYIQISNIEKVWITEVIKPPFESLWLLIFCGLTANIILFLKKCNEIIFLNSIKITKVSAVYAWKEDCKKFEHLILSNKLTISNHFSLHCIVVPGLAKSTSKQVYNELKIDVLQSNGFYSILFDGYNALPCIIKTFKSHYSISLKIFILKFTLENISQIRYLHWCSRVHCIDTFRAINIFDFLWK